MPSFVHSVSTAGGFDSSFEGVGVDEDNEREQEENAEADEVYFARLMDTLGSALHTVWWCCAVSVSLCHSLCDNNLSRFSVGAYSVIATQARVCCHRYRLSTA